jgi:hypothetical protein
MKADVFNVLHRMFGGDARIDNLGQSTSCPSHDVVQGDIELRGNVAASGRCLDALEGVPISGEFPLIGLSRVFATARAAG